MGAHEFSDLRMCDSRDPVDEVVRAQEPTSPAGTSDQQLAIHEIVPGGFVGLEQTVQFRGMGHPAGEETNPDGSIYEDHQANALVLPTPGLRLGTSVAPRSEPLSFRSLS